MPWTALDFNDREFKELLSKVFDVNGIPKLVWLNPITGEINHDGRKSISLGW